MSNGITAPSFTGVLKQPRRVNPPFETLETLSSTGQFFSVEVLEVTVVVDEFEIAPLEVADAVVPDEELAET